MHLGEDRVFRERDGERQVWAASEARRRSMRVCDSLVAELRKPRAGRRWFSRTTPKSPGGFDGKGIAATRARV